MDDQMFHTTGEPSTPKPTIHKGTHLQQALSQIGNQADRLGRDTVDVPRDLTPGWPATPVWSGFDPLI